ncbi:hypothetical protein [Bradyrhizobium sp. USDA 4454]
MFTLSTSEMTMLKFLVAGVATFGFVAAASAADLPHPQPVTATAPVGKMPIGKYPVGKYPVGKYPVGKAPAPLVTKG